ncbi:MAG: amidohydrolase family protein [Candidatus Thiodiazotropha sp. (ex. Lucinisca nassula)]|nr:amidohydrolase family protein [Candidatus Thiodiazotropha sp. (ex. Lucinisca nassula)]MBW9262949.1 amidohydrolase family protein [Candidatus Thiodiazotropha sp. (ex. Lucinisca nassula)]
MRSSAALLLSLFVSVAASKAYSPLPAGIVIAESPKADIPFDLQQLKQRWIERIVAIKQAGVLPIIDIESSFNPGRLNARTYAQAMDDNGIALTAFSPQIGEKKYNKKGSLWHEASRRAIGVDPSRYIPATTAGIYPAFTKQPDAFIEMSLRKVKQQGYPMLGEFEFRHYMSPRQFKRGQTYRDVAIDIDSPAAEKLFEFSQRTGISFQIHYEIEDQLLPPLEKMLARYPNARVIWCHLGQVRYSNRTTRYQADYVRHLIEHYPGIHFDLAFGNAESIYPGSGERQSRVWRPDGSADPAWVSLINDHPYRFLAALDIGGDRQDKLPQKVNSLRRFLQYLSPQVREIVAYRAAWRLLFNEEIDI